MESQTELVQRILNTIGKIFNDMSVSTSNDNIAAVDTTDMTLNIATNSCDNINLSSEGLSYNAHNNTYNFLNNNNNTSNNNLISTTDYNNLSDRIIINVDNNNIAALATTTTTSNNVLHSLHNYPSLLESNTLLDPSANISKLLSFILFLFIRFLRDYIKNY